MARNRHPNKHIEKAVKYAEALGWRVVMVKRGHAWGRIFCPEKSREGCRFSIWSSPQAPDNHARHIRSRVDFCSHCQDNLLDDEAEGEPS